MAELGNIKAWELQKCEKNAIEFRISTMRSLYLKNKATAQQNNKLAP
jgi:hypothetical protein